MKILQICPGAYLSGRGGISEHVVRVSEALSRLGHDVTVFATNPGGLAWSEVVNGVKVRRFKRFAPDGAYFFSPCMLSALLTANFDLVHAHGFHAFPMHFASLAKCKKFVVTPHFHGSGHSVFRDCLFNFFKFLGRSTLFQADEVIAVSKFEKNLLLKQFGLDDNKIVVVPNGVNFSEFIGLKRQERCFRTILYVGRLEDYKGVPYLVDVLPHLPKDVVLEIVGRGRLRASLENRGKELGLDSRISFFQDLPKVELLQKYVNADLFVLLSRHEAYSLAVAESLVAGTPCIVADTSALSEWIDNVHCMGVKVPVQLGILAELIGKVLEVKKDMSDLGISGKIMDWMNVAQKLDEIYKT